MNHENLPNNEMEMSLVDIGVYLYLRRLKILVLMLLISTVGLLLKGIPTKVEQIESLIKVGSYNSKFAIEDPNLFSHMVEYYYLPESSKNKKIKITAQPIDISKRLMKLITPMNGIETSEIIKVHNDVMLKIIEKQNNLKDRPEIVGNQLIYFTTPTEIIFVGKKVIIPAWTRPVFFKYFILLGVSFIMSILGVLIWDYIIAVKIKSKNYTEPSK